VLLEPLERVSKMQEDQEAKPSLRHLPREDPVRTVLLASQNHPICCQLFGDPIVFRMFMA
jgi:hypothetical protein